MNTTPAATAGTTEPGERPPRRGIAHALCIVLHDVAPSTWAACERVRERVQSLSVPGAPLPMTLLAVPQHHGQSASPMFERWLEVAASRGDEIALHGYTHRDDGVPHGWLDHARRRWYTAGEGEFAALTKAEARERLLAGMAWFGQHGWPLHGFVAPAWLLSAGSWQALDELGFRYTCTLGGLVALPTRERLRSQSIVYSTRSRWRRVLSVLWNQAVAHHEQGQPLLRFELHPNDADHAAVLESWMGLLARALRCREALTLAEASARQFKQHAPTGAGVR